MKVTKLKSLWRWYWKLRGRMIIILLILYIVSSFLVLTFFENDLFYKIWLYDNKKTLDTFTF